MYISFFDKSTYAGLLRVSVSFILWTATKSSLNTKIKYVVHYRNLQLYLNLGLKFKKVHRVFKFVQSA